MTNSPSGFWWVGSELPVFLTVLGTALREYVRPTAALSVSSCLGLTLWLTDAPINHCGQGGLMRLVISLIPVKKIAFWDGRRSRSHHIDFSSPQFILTTRELGLGRRLSPSGTCMTVCVCVSSVIHSYRSHFCKHSWQHLKSQGGGKNHGETSECSIAESANDELQKQLSRALVFSPAVARFCRVQLSSNNNVWTQHLWADRQRGRQWRKNAASLPLTR